MIDDQIAFVVAERVAGHREEEVGGGTAVLYFCPNHLSCGVVQRMCVSAQLFGSKISCVCIRMLDVYLGYVHHSPLPGG